MLSVTDDLEGWVLPSDSHMFPMLVNQFFLSCVMCLRAGQPCVAKLTPWHTLLLFGFRLSHVRTLLPGIHKSTVHRHIGFPTEAEWLPPVSDKYRGHTNGRYV